MICQLNYKQQQLKFQQLQEKYVLLSKDKKRQDVNMKRWVGRATRNEFHRFFRLIRVGINEISAYDGPRLWKD